MPPRVLLRKLFHALFVICRVTLSGFSFAFLAFVVINQCLNTDHSPGKDHHRKASEKDVDQSFRQCTYCCVERQIKCTKKIKLNAKRNNVKFNSIQII